MEETKNEKHKRSEKEIEKRTLSREVINLFTLFTGMLYGELDERLGVKEAIRKNLKKPVPSHVNWTFCFGGIAFFLFMILAITGVLLMIYYRPTTAEAYKSVVMITNLVPYGWLIRGVHFWAANLMVLLVILHMIRVFFYGAYKPPRDFNWVAGVMLLILTMAFGFSGYLLPWNQVSYWATTVVTDATGALPVVGKYLVYFVRGGPDVSQFTLNRFFTLHVVVLPAITMMFLFVHFAMLRKQGISGPMLLAGDGVTKNGKGDHSGKDSIPFFPHHFLKELIVMGIVMGVLVSLATFLPAPMEDPADPFVTPAHLKPEWYFLANYKFLQMTEYLIFIGAWAPKVLGVIGQMVVVMILMFFPFLDKNPERLPKKRPFMITIGIISLIIYGVMIYMGYVK